MPCLGRALLSARCAALASSSRAPLAVRFLSSTPPLPPPPTGAAGLLHSAQRALAIALNTYGPLTGLAAGGGVVIYGVSSLALHVTTTFMSLSLTDALYGGFGAGFLSCGALVAAGLRSYRRVTIHPDAVFKLALSKVQRDARVAGALGATVKPGALQAYNLVAGHVSTQKLGWVDPRVQMLFSVVGADTGREGMVRACFWGG